MNHSPLRKYHSEICHILDGSNASLQSFTVSLYSKGIIDRSTKHSVMRNRGIAGADELMDAVARVVNTNPAKYLRKVLDTMGKVKILEDMSQSIRQGKSCCDTTPLCQGLKTNPATMFGTQVFNLQNGFQEALRLRVSQVTCKCGEIAVLRTVKKNNENHGRQFYTCPREMGCCFFEWADSAPPKGVVGKHQLSVSREKMCNCDPPLPAVKRTVRKTGIHNGKEFWVCPKSREKQCGYFEFIENKKQVSTKCSSCAL